MQMEQVFESPVPRQRQQARLRAICEGVDQVRTVLLLDHTFRDGSFSIRLLNNSQDPLNLLCGDFYGRTARQKLRMSERWGSGGGRRGKLTSQTDQWLECKTTWGWVHCSCNWVCNAVPQEKRMPHFTLHKYAQCFQNDTVILFWNW